MYRSIEKWSRDNLTLGIGKTIGGNSAITSLYPDVEWEETDLSSGVDAEDLPWENDSIDILVSDQMLEHVKHPWVVRDEIVRVLKSKGILILTTCFSQIHHSDNVYFTFHMEGLESLFQSYFDPCICEGWGNQEANELINWNYDIRVKPIGADEKLKELVEINDFRTPFTTWVMGKKI